MTEDERQQAIQRHIGILKEDRARAEEGLANIAAGWTFHEAQGNEPMRDVTASRAEHYQGIISKCDQIISAYEKWNA